MAGWHPNQIDGGLLPHPPTPNNPAQAYNPFTIPTFAEPFYYGNGCDVRLRPHVLNSLISENLAVVDRVGLAYRPGQLTNLRTAIEYIVQRGLPKFTILYNGPTYYNGPMDPPCQAYNNGQVALVIPVVRNQGFVRIDMGPGWWAPVLRNDYMELESGDWNAYVPQLIGYWNGAWYMLGMVQSQIPIVLKGTIGFWIRTDGNDVSGDGTENRPDKAFRTINGCWAAIGSKYMASPTAHIAMRFGIPGTYERGSFGPFGATVSLTGDPNNRTAYRIETPTYDPFSSIGLQVAGVTNCYLSGITFVLTNPHPKAHQTSCVRSHRSGVAYDRCMFEVLTHNPEGVIMWHEAQSSLGPGWHPDFQGDCRIQGHGHTILMGTYIWLSSYYQGTTPGLPNPFIWIWENLNFVWGGYVIVDGSTWGQGIDMVHVAGCGGKQFLASNNSTIHLAGRPGPGNQPGQLTNYSSFIG